MKIKVAGFVVILIGGFFLFLNYTPFGQNSEQTVNDVAKETITVSLNIEGVMAEKNIEVVDNSTVLNLLETLSEQESVINLKTEVYDGIGTLVTGIGEKQNGNDNYYWQYTVNEVMPMIGADAYTLSDGDFVLWEFKESTF